MALASANKSEICEEKIKIKQTEMISVNSDHQIIQKVLMSNK